MRHLEWRMATVIPEGCVPFNIVVMVLERAAPMYGYTVRLSGSVVTLVKDSVPEAVVLPNYVGRRMVTRLAHKYCGGHVEFFYHPDMLADGGGAAH